MRYDPTKPDWIHFAQARPIADIAGQRMFSYTPLADAFGELLALANVADWDAVRESLSADLESQLTRLYPLWLEARVRKRLPGRPRCWRPNDFLVLRFVGPHEALHVWLDSRLATGHLIDSPLSAGFMMREALKAEPDWRPAFAARVPKPVSAALQEHTSRHHIFRLWCIFWEAAVRLVQRLEFPQWLVDDLTDLARYSTVVLQDSSDGVKKQMAPGPGSWAVDVLEKRKKRAPRLHTKWCPRCSQPFEEHRPGHPSDFCPICRPIDRLKKNREAHRRSRSASRSGLPSVAPDAMAADSN